MNLIKGRIFIEIKQALQLTEEGVAILVSVATADTSKSPLVTPFIELLLL